MYRSLAFLFVFVSLAGCRTPSYSDKFGELKNVSAVTFKPHSATEDYTVSDEKIIKELLKNINNAKQDGLWKGADWDELRIVTADSVVVLKTNGKVFGRNGSGTFYRFPSKDILKIIPDQQPANK